MNKDLACGTRNLGRVREFNNRKTNTQGNSGPCLGEDCLKKMGNESGSGRKLLKIEKYFCTGRGKKKRPGEVSFLGIHIWNVKLHGLVRNVRHIQVLSDWFVSYVTVVDVNTIYKLRSFRCRFFNTKLGKK